MADGLWEEYYENGQLKVRGALKDGNWEGLFEAYWEDGKVWSKGVFKDNKKCGEWEEWWLGDLEIKKLYFGPCPPDPAGVN
jgi:antitoxin component YwqK of YwqJK toxin-antitoxin module